MADMTLYEYDEAVRNDYSVICGVDEAGRGPLAGDVYAAAVVLNKDTVIEGINDSKICTRHWKALTRCRSPRLMKLLKRLNHTALQQHLLRRLTG